MTRLACLSLALVSIVPASAGAAAETGQYRAELVAPSASARLIVRDTVWHCDGDACVAPAGTSRPAVICSALVRQAGALRSFALDGKALDGDALEKCNARAR